MMTISYQALSPRKPGELESSWHVLARTTTVISIRHDSSVGWELQMLTLDELKETLVPFSDPATEFAAEASNANFRVRLTHDGSTREYFVDRTNGSVEQRLPDTRRYQSLNSLLASPELADLRFMADNQRRLLEGLSAEPQIPVQLTLGDADGSIADLRAYLGKQHSNRIRVCLVDGPAGIGKTHLIEALTFERCEAYRRGESPPPILHVTSRGRRLSNLRDVIAACKDIVRAKFTFEQVPVLVRRGLLLLAIDGFDELVDADGYKDAWFALRDVLHEIGAGGTIILAGRDTFFDEQGFLQRLEESARLISLQQVHVQPLRPEAGRVWLRGRGWSDEDVNSSAVRDLFVEGSYALRPFCLSELGRAGGLEALTGSLREFLVSRFIDREIHLLEKMVRIDAAAGAQALRQLFDEVAMDMGEREADTVDAEYLALICELVFEGILDPQDIKKLQHKIGSLALLEQDSVGRLRRFPHVEIQHYFLGRALIRSMNEGNTPLVLRRGVLGLDALEVFAEAFDAESAENAKRFLDRLQYVLAHEIASDRLPSNAASLLLAALGRQEELSYPAVALSALETSEATVSGMEPAATLDGVLIGRLDTRGADLRRVLFHEGRITNLIADATTRLASVVPPIDVLHIVEGTRSQTLRAPEDVARWIERHRSPKADPSIPAAQTLPRDEDLPLVAFFDRVCRRALRQFYFRHGGEDPGGVLLEHPSWAEVATILEGAGRIERVVRQMGGPPAQLVHIRNPRALLEPPKDDAVSLEVRQAIVRRARELAD
jgi:hypothetical protein